MSVEVVGPAAGGAGDTDEPGWAVRYVTDPGILALHITQPTRHEHVPRKHPVGWKYDPGDGNPSYRGTIFLPPEGFHSRWKFIYFGMLDN